MARVAATLPGYTTVSRAAEVLHLAPRSVRDLIYAGRLPSLRIGRLHYVRAADLDLERRRRLGLRLPQRAPRRSRPRVVSRTAAESPPADTEAQTLRVRHVDPEVRRRRAAERAEVVQRWAARHHPATPRVPFAAVVSEDPVGCAACGRVLRPGERAVQALETAERLCLTCGRRALLDWADHRRLEAAAARRLAQDLSAPDSQVA